MACDICGKTGRSLNRLLSSYQTEDIKDVCEDCERVINERLLKLKAVTNNILCTWFKRFMRSRKLASAEAAGETGVDPGVQTR